MIELRITPTTITSGSPTRLELIAYNVGDGVCIDIVVRIALPLGLRMVGGSGRVRIPRLSPGSSHPHPFQVVARQPGRYHVTAPNFSYQDAMGRSQHVELDGWTLAAVAEPAPADPTREAAPGRDHRVAGEMAGTSLRAMDETAGIFISYRRKDEPAFAGRLYDKLAARFGGGQVFMDVYSIDLGLDFTDVLNDTLSLCKVLIAVIGHNWLIATDEHGARRLDQQGDFVRLEIETALGRNIRVIPILVDDAPMPQASELPSAIGGLGSRHGCNISNDRFGSDCLELINTLDRLLTGSQEVSRPNPNRRRG